MTTPAAYIDPADFNELYFNLRKREGRHYTDEEVMNLPDIPSSHVYSKEWLARKRSSEKLINYLKKKQEQLKILEAGCGNGWLSHRLAEIPESKVIGIDINFNELEQAAKIFSDCSNLHFIYGDLRSGLFGNNQFDIIVFASSIQYFPSLTDILNTSLKLLKEKGEIHIIDTNFYKAGESVAAKKRSHEYFSKMGFPEMNDLYFHHPISELDAFNSKILYQPSRKFFLKNSQPFPWIVITNEKRK